MLHSEQERQKPLIDRKEIKQNELHVCLVAVLKTSLHLRHKHQIS